MVNLVRFSIMDELSVEERKTFCHQNTRDTKLHQDTFVNLGVLGVLVAKP